MRTRRTRRPAPDLTILGAARGVSLDGRTITIELWSPRIAEQAMREIQRLMAGSWIDGVFCDRGTEPRSR